MSKLSRFLNHLGVIKQPSSMEETEVPLTVDASQEIEEQKINNHESSKHEKKITMKEEENNANSSEEQKVTKDKARNQIPWSMSSSDSLKKMPTSVSNI